MSTIHDTTRLKTYKRRNMPNLDESLIPFLSQELQNISNSINALVIAAQALEARIVAGGL